jgi:predicted permease
MRRTLERLGQDFRLAWRGLRRTRGFTVTAVLTLTVGIAGTTVMFALVRGVLLRPLPLPNPDRLVVAWSEPADAQASHWPLGLDEVRLLARSGGAFERVAGVGYNGAVRTIVTENGAASYLRTTPVTGDFFSVLDVSPILGRAFTAADDVAGSEPVAVITYALWQRRYGGTHDVLDRVIEIREQRFRIAGVMPADVEYPRGVEVWTTVAGMTKTLANAAFRVDVDVMARLAPGVSLAQAEGEVGTILATFGDKPGSGRPHNLRPVVRRYSDIVVGDVRYAIVVLFAAVALVLLIASANVANLWLLRGEGRRAEIAVRAALGAGRGRLVQQMVVEGLALAPAAAALGLLVAWWALPAIVRFVPNELPRLDVIGIDASVIAFAIVVSLAATAFSGLTPAILFTRSGLLDDLRGTGRTVAMRTSRAGRRALVIAQVALAVTAVAAAGLLVRSLLSLQAADMGLAADRLLFVELQLPLAKAHDKVRHLQFLGAAIAELEAAPGVAGVTPVAVPPFAGRAGWDLPRFTGEGQSADQAATNPALNLESVHANYFRTFGVAVIRGRSFAAEDRQNAPPVAIVSEDVAERTWPNEDPIGKRIKFGGVTSPDDWKTVVGVAAVTRYRELAEPRPTLYLPAEQFIVAAQTLVVRTSGPVAAISALARSRLAAIDPDVQIVRIVPFAQLLDAPLARPRFNAFLIAFFGGAALLLAAIGLYAVVAASVRQRYREIGLRVALGASRSQVGRLVLTEGLTLAVAGSIIGLAASAAGARLLSQLLFGVHPLDPMTLSAAALLLIAIAALASCLPARRAQQIDPAILLRQE